MKRFPVRFLCAMLAAVFCLPPLLFLRANAAPEPQITCPQAICYQLESGTVLYAKGEEDRIAPASFVKLMTALLAFEYRKQNGNLPVTVEKEMIAGVSGNRMGLQEGEILMLDDLLAGLCVAGANDAALVLASHVGGNIPDFVAAMNERAKMLGMKNTSFANPTGMDSPMMTSTLSDLLLLCREIYRVNDFIVLSSQRSYAVPATNLSKARTLQNRNRVLFHHYVYPYYISGTRGMVAGATNNSGYCIATTREKNGGTTLVLLSGGKDESENHDETGVTAYKEAKVLLEWAESNFQRVTVVSEGTVIREESVSLASDVDHAILVAGETLYAYLDKETRENGVTFEINLKKNGLTAPIVKGEEFGTVTYFAGGKALGSVPLVAQSGIQRSQAGSFWSGVKRFFSTGPAFVILVLIILVAATYLIILVFTVIRQNLRAGKERRAAEKRLNDEENRRLEKVRKKERERRGVRLRSAGSFFREGFRVMTGGTAGEAARNSAGRNPGSAPRKGVARVPEKYRKYPSGTAAPPRAVRPANPAETRRKSAPKRAGAPNRTAPPRAPAGWRAGNHPSQNPPRRPAAPPRKPNGVRTERKK